MDEQIRVTKDEQMEFTKQIEEFTKQIEELGEELQSLQKTNLACMLLHKNALADYSYETEGFTLTAGGVSVLIRRFFDIRINRYSWNEFVYEGIPLTDEQNIAFLEMLHKGHLINQICRLKKQIEQEKKNNESLRKSMQEGE